MTNRVISTEYCDIEIPSTLYKYRSLHGAERKFASHIITRRELWFCPASQLNDDFDCNPIPKLTASRLSNEFAMRRTLRNQFPKMLKHRVKSLAAYRAKRPRQEFESLMARMIEKERETIGICSLSSEPDCEKLWDDYGASHTGICLRFNDPANDTLPAPYFQLAMKVNYEEHRPEISVYGESGFEKLTKYILTKTRKWEYETEWRLVEQNFTGNKPFPPARLTGIIFGKGISPSDRAEVISWASLGSTPIEFLQAYESLDGISVKNWPIT